jgi:hypothetical protein
VGRTADVLPLPLKWRHVKMKNNLYLIPLIGRHREDAASDGRVLCALAMPPFLSSPHATLLCGESDMVAQTGPEKPPNYRGNAVKRTGTKCVYSRWVSERGVHAASTSNPMDALGVNHTPRNSATLKQTKARTLGTLRKGQKIRKNHVEQARTRCGIGAGPLTRGHLATPPAQNQDKITHLQAA